MACSGEERTTRDSPLAAHNLRLKSIHNTKSTFFRTYTRRVYILHSTSPRLRLRVRVSKQARGATHTQHDAFRGWLSYVEAVRMYLCAKVIVGLLPGGALPVLLLVGLLRVPAFIAPKKRGWWVSDYIRQRPAPGQHFTAPTKRVQCLSDCLHAATSGNVHVPQKQDTPTCFGKITAKRREALHALHASALDTSSPVAIGGRLHMFHCCVSSGKASAKQQPRFAPSSLRRIGATETKSADQRRTLLFCGLRASKLPRWPW